MSDDLLIKMKNRFFIFAIPIALIAGFLANVDKKTPLQFSADGKVVIAKWNTRNHGMHLFVIQQNSAAANERKFEGSNIILTPEQIKFGDRFSKVAGSKICTINDVDIQCLK